LSPAAVAQLSRYDWPGNVRELRNVVESVVVLARDSTIGEEQVVEVLKGRGRIRSDLPVHLGREAHSVEHEMIYRALVALRDEVAGLRELMERARGSGPERTPVESRDLRSTERELIEAILSETGGNRREAARRLGISERTLYRRLRQYQEANGDNA
jgi:DNA-binding NtrC family response regulator